MKKTYADILKIVENSTENLFVAVFWPTGRHTWLPVDKKVFIEQIKAIDDPAKYEYPCYFEVEPDGQMFIHSAGKQNEHGELLDEGRCSCGEDH